MRDLSGKIVSVVNRKGGVGKTTLTLALADTLVGESELPYDPAKTLVVAVDLDPQASLTKALLYDRTQSVQHSRLKRTIDAGMTLASVLDGHLKKKKKSVEEFLTHGVGPNGFTYSMLANDARAWDIERRALKAPGEARLKAAVSDILRELADSYRYVLVDCPPGQTVTTEAAIQISDLVLCPTTPDWLSYWGLESFDEYLQDVCDGDHHPPARFVFTKFKSKVPRYDPQDEIHSRVSEFTRPKNYVTLLRESGADSSVGRMPITLPFDPKLVSRLEGSPRPGRRWPWSRMYTADTQSALKRLVSAVQRELGDGGPCSTPQRTRSMDKAKGHAGRDDPQITR